MYEKTIDDVLSEKGTAQEPVKYTDTQSESVLKAQALGLVNGMGNGKFAPDAIVTKEQAAIMLLRSAVILKIKYEFTIKTISDLAKVPGYSYDSVQFTIDSGMLPLNEKGEFAPKKTISMAEAVSASLRLYSIYNDHKDMVKICTIGNSLMFSGDTIAQLKQLCSNAGFHVWVDDNLVSNGVLYDTVDGMAESYGSDYFTNTDFEYIILNEHGSLKYSQKKSLERLYEIPLPEKARVIFMITEFDYGETMRMDDLAIFPQVEVCDPFTTLLELVVGKEYDYREFDMGDYHPNELHAFINACALFSHIFEKNPAEYVQDPCPVAHGQNDEEKLKETTRIAQKVWDRIQKAQGE